MMQQDPATTFYVAFLSTIKAKTATASQNIFDRIRGFWTNETAVWAELSASDQQTCFIARLYKGNYHFYSYHCAQLFQVKM